MKRFEFKQGNSAKFWEVEIKGKKTRVRYGRIGTAGRVIEKTHASPAAAKSEAKKLTLQKTSKGYKPVRSQKKSVTKSKSARAKSTDIKIKQPKPGDVVDVTGIIEAASAGGSQVGDSWTLVTGFERWKLTDGQMLEGSVRIEQPGLTTRQLNHRMVKRFLPYSVFRLRLKISKHRRMGLMGEIVKDFGPSKDPELLKIVKQLKKPVSFKDPELGKFELVRALSWYEGKSVKWCGSKIRVTLDECGGGVANHSLEAARSLWKAQKNWTKIVTDFIVDELHSLANDWLDQDDAKPITAASFRRRIKLTSISIDAQSDFTFWFDADDIFRDHAICVHGNVSGELREATIA